jgi:single-strand DNA-binding protein
MGNLTRDGELRYLPSGKPVFNFSMAVSDRYKKGDEWIEEVSYFDVVVFKQAESCAQYIGKGSKVLVDGRLKQRRWDSNGQKRSKVEIVSNNVQFLSKPVDQLVEQVVNDSDIPF